ncbi:thiopurine S-methyltransferase [Aeromonas molluscorum]|uniref:Thiopurine S-methyltransferase n=1 Tax=Aeromonas molluscorum 848 TaxID=1268236 RepID=R1HBR3_9GAMM|nr:thiopurine S-methyltransferase [Aeromonas molluscorum]EOD55869.1 thiopurine S-methyltransferase [Aeromonas molluscorum 848]
MEAAFWHKRWEENRIGFHQADVNPFLPDCWQGRPEQGPVLVPLCGKSADMVWLSRQGNAVHGFELSELAVSQFFEEQELCVQQDVLGPYRRHLSGEIALHQGDFFAAAELGHRYQLAYDRAALIALPTAMRQDYADLMARLMVAGGEVLLITLEYQPEQQAQPPFSVGELAVRALFERSFRVEVLGRRSEQEHPRVIAGQLSYFDEVAYRLTRRG